MIKCVRYTACVLAVIAAASCSDKPGTTPEAAAAATPVALETAASTPAISPEHAAALKGFITKSGNACIDIVSVQGEDLSNKVKVTCSGQAGDAATASYTVDLATEQVQKDG